MRIFTIGNERAALGDFVATLKRFGTTTVLDVRELPLSHRRGFSKSSLGTALARAGIEYQHERALGTPRAIRHRLREDRNLERYFRRFRGHLRTQSALLDALAPSLESSVALLCYERGPARCHRSVVAEALAKRLRSRVDHLDQSREGFWLFTWSLQYFLMSSRTAASAIGSSLPYLRDDFNFR